MRVKISVHGKSQISFPYTDNLQYHFVNYMKITITQGSVTWKWYLETAIISLWNSFWFRKNRNLFEKLSFLTFRIHTMNQCFLSYTFIIERSLCMSQFLQEDWLSLTRQSRRGTQVLTRLTKVSLGNWMSWLSQSKSSLWNLRTRLKR